jgi:hypothetical protein
LHNNIKKSCENIARLIFCLSKEAERERKTKRESKKRKRREKKERERRRTFFIMSTGRDVDLKDESEVQEYLERLATEYRFSCYHEKDPKGEREKETNFKVGGGSTLTRTVLLIS